MFHTIFLSLFSMIIRCLSKYFCYLVGIWLSLKLLELFRTYVWTYCCTVLSLTAFFSRFQWCLLSLSLHLIIWLGVFVNSIYSRTDAFICLLLWAIFMRVTHKLCSENRIWIEAWTFHQSYKIHVSQNLAIFSILIICELCKSTYIIC